MSFVIVLSCESLATLSRVLATRLGAKEWQWTEDILWMLRFLVSSEIFAELEFSIALVHCT